MIRGKRPRAYNSTNKTYEDVMIPALSVDFDDTKTLPVMISEISSELESHTAVLASLADSLSQEVALPVQKGKLIYSGYEQAPILIYDSSRIMLSGNITGTAAQTYTAYATLLSGSWQDGSTVKTRSFTWSIEKGKISKPYQSRQYIETGEKITLDLENFISSAMTKQTGTSVFSATKAGEYTASISLTNSNYTWYDGTTAPCQIKWRIFPSYSLADLPVSSGDLDSDTLLAINTLLSKNYDTEISTIKSDIEKMKAAMITKTSTI